MGIFKFNLYFITFQILVVLLLSCTPSSNPSQNQINNGSHKMFSINESINISEVKKTLEYEKNINLPLYLDKTIYGENNELLDNLLHLRSKRNILDSLYKGYQLDIDRYTEYENQKGINPKDSNYAEFIGQIKNNIQDRALFIMLSPNITRQYASDLQYIVMVLADDSSFKIIDQTVIGVYYKKYSFGENFHFSFFDIDISKDLEITLHAKRSAWESFSPFELVNLKVNKNEIKRIKDIVYNHQGDLDGNYAQNYYYLKIKDSIYVSFDQYEEDAFNQFYLQLNYQEWNIERGEYMTQPISDTLQVKDHLGRPWLDIIYFNPKAQYCNDEAFINGCNTAHYIRYIYESTADSIPYQYLEVQYEHLSNNKLLLKTRLDFSLDWLKYENWRQITLPAYTEYNMFYEEALENKDKVNWNLSYDLLSSSILLRGLEDHIDILPSRARVVRDSIKIAKNKRELEQIDSLLRNIPLLKVNGLTTTDFKPIIQSFPPFFYSYFDIDSTFKVVGVIDNLDDTKLNMVKMITYSKASYYIHSHYHTEKLPISTPLNIEGKTLKYKYLEKRKARHSIEYKMLNKVIHFDAHGHSGNSVNLKMLRYSQFYPNVVLKVKVGRGDDQFEFSNVYDIIPKHAGSPYTFTDLQNRKCFDLISYSKRKGHYKRYLYANENSEIYEQILEVKYIVDEATNIIKLQFKMANTEILLNKASFITHNIYPKDHALYQQWEWDYFNVKSKRALKKILKRKK